VPRQGVHSRITTRFGRERPRALDPCALSPSERKQFRQTDLTRHDVYHLITSFVMFGRGITTLAFSCERTAMNPDQKMMVGAFVCCNGLLADS
jgi:hypothetical protein